jgi:hypothetical protein
MQSSWMLVADLAQPHGGLFLTAIINQHQRITKMLKNVTNTALNKGQCVVYGHYNDGVRVSY